VGGNSRAPPLSLLLLRLTLRSSYPPPPSQYLMKKTTYRYLASLVDLHYFGIYSWTLLPPNMTQYYGVELMNEVSGVGGIHVGRLIIAAALAAPRAPHTAPPYPLPPFSLSQRYFWENCVATNISSYDALNYHACNAASKNYPIVVDLPQLNQVLRDAVDSIGAYSLRNKAWKAIVEAQGIAKPSPPPWIKNTRK
jgi:hypothetical protein